MPKPNAVLHAQSGRSITGYATFLAKNGLHRTIFEFINNHPGVRLPAAQWALEFKCNASTCRKIAQRFEAELRKSGAQIPKRKPAGTNNPNGFNQAKNAYRSFRNSLK